MTRQTYVIRTLWSGRVYYLPCGKIIYRPWPLDSIAIAAFWVASVGAIAWLA
jgi:hypothetical protein